MAKTPPAGTDELKMLRRLSRLELVEVGNLIVMGSHEDLIRLRNNPKATMLELMVASIAANIIRKGDVYAFAEFMKQMGIPLDPKVKGDGPSLSGNVLPQVQHLPRIVITLPSNGREISSDG